MACTDPNCLRESTSCDCLKPITYADWDKDVKTLFTGLATDGKTITRVINYAANNQKRHAFGYKFTSTTNNGVETITIDGKFLFHISIPDGSTGDTNIHNFGLLHEAWRKTRPNPDPQNHRFLQETLADTNVPPSCGTPNTPKCPPDPLLRGAMNYLRDLKAGPGAYPNRILEATMWVENFLITQINTEITNRGVSPPTYPAPLLVSAMRFLRDLNYQRDLATGAGASIDRAALEVEQLLVTVIEQQAPLLLV